MPSSRHARLGICLARVGAGLPVLEYQSAEGAPDWSFHVAVGHLGRAASWSAAGAIQVAVDRGPADVQGLGDRRYRVLPGCIHL